MSIGVQLHPRVHHGLRVDDRLREFQLLLPQGWKGKMGDGGWLAGWLAVSRIGYSFYVLVVTRFTTNLTARGGGCDFLWLTGQAEWLHTCNDQVLSRRLKCE